MRMIEKAMLNAIECNRAFNVDNTSVIVRPWGAGDGHKFEVFLHGNHIANVFYSDTFTKVVRVEFTFAGWQTPTTKSRINAVLSLIGTYAGCYQQKGKLYFRAVAGAFDNRLEIDAKSWYSFEGSICQKLAGV